MTTPAETAYQKAGGEGVEELVLEHLDLVSRIVDRSFYAMSDFVPRDDLIGAGMLGLVEAAHRYDPSRDASFATFAAYRVKGAVVDSLRQNDWLGKSAREALQTIRRQISDFRAAHGRRPNLQELAELAGMSEADVLKYLSYGKWDHVGSIDCPVQAPDGEQAPLSVLIPAEAETPAEQAEFNERVERLSRAIQELPEQQQQVIVMYYYEDLYMSEMAEVLGVTEGRISQIHTQALYNLTRALEER